VCNEALDRCDHNYNNGLCEDHIDCTTNYCAAWGGCVFLTNNSYCDDGLFCNGTETCSPQGCQAGTSPCVAPGLGQCSLSICHEDTDFCESVWDHGLCEDGLDCTTDYCAVYGGCVYFNDCDDEIACTTDTCTAQGCVFTPDHGDCNDAVACTIDTCVAGTGCTNVPEDLLCADDGVACTDEVCDAEDGCQLVFNHSACDDGVGCTFDQCTENGCSNVPDHVSCQDGLWCTGTEWCDLYDGCQSGTPVNCADSGECTEDVCNEALDRCDHNYNNGLCEDHIDCTTNYCAAWGGCVFLTNNSYCDDGLFCNGTETCSPQGCQAGTSPCVAPGLGQCSLSICHEDTDFCESVWDHGLCEDGLDCTTDYCAVYGGCVYFNDCDDEIACTTDTCTAQGCVFTPDHGDCNDAVACTIDTCEVGVGCVHTPDCDDEVDCTVDTCHPTAGCQHAADHSACDDEIDCTFDQCNVSLGDCVNTPVDSWCDDELFCNGDEYCDAATGCEAGNDPCPNQGCNETTDACTQCAINAHCPVGQVCCNGVCRSCCTNADCASGYKCCPQWNYTCRLSCKLDLDPD
jgi:hypothetical protein